MQCAGIVIVTVIIVAACGGGSGGVCGPDIATGVITASDPDETVSLVYDNFTAAPGLCDDPAAPAGVVSLSIRGRHENGGEFAFCIPRPDRLEETGRVGGGELELLSTDASTQGCTFELSPGAGGFGGAEVGGFCGGGLDPAGFRFTSSIQTSVRRDCVGTVTTLTMVFIGTVEVVPE